MYEKLLDLLKPPYLTRTRVTLAYTVAVATDAVQLILGPLGLTLVDEVLDVVAAVVTAQLIGFHPLLLPTLVLEFIPIADLLPTWTGCVAIVVALRRREQASMPPPPPGPGPVIDV
jgi:hypothetical protein